MPSLFLSLLLLFALPVSAELYKWTDAEGKIHFGDRPPENQATESLEIDVQNNDFELQSEESAAYFNKVRQNEAISQQKQARDAQNQAQAQQKKQALCQKARNHLATLQGPVYFEKEDGSTYEISEKEREARAKEFAKEVQRYCN